MDGSVTKVVVVTNGNDDQVPLIGAMVRSFRAFWDLAVDLEPVVLSDELSQRSIQQLRKIGVRVVMLDDGFVDRLKCDLSSNVHPLERSRSRFSCRTFSKPRRTMRFSSIPTLIA
jgi:fructose-1,6-bisphosphatase/sedoheptulose 1,7-bisphosphatase-like protein